MLFIFSSWIATARNASQWRITVLNFRTDPYFMQLNALWLSWIYTKIHKTVKKELENKQEYTKIYTLKIGKLSLSYTYLNINT